ncbi:hypothetical protein WR25_07936 isoform A [Diploscapter pachys]|uniref:Eyes absent homolog n=3 Tax=Diploscapter pachys TaxID=2018661 RepID=A0A2A2KKF6_9BILA|nr:hypothetical protein WR25_07936 isoform A [Diploscapter pachys]
MVKPEPFANTDTNSVVASVWSGSNTVKQMTASERAALVISDAAAAYGNSAYYNPAYGSYNVYGTATNPAAAATAFSYQQMAASASLRTPTAFPYALGSATSAAAYYGGSYPTNLDYTAYNSQYYSGMRNSYYPNALSTAAYNAASISADATADLTVFPLKADKKSSSKSSKKKKPSSSPGDAQYARVFIWELHEICAITKQYLDHFTQKALQLNPASQYYRLLGQILDNVVSRSFSMDPVEESDVCNVEDATIEETVGEGAMVDVRGGVELVRRLAAKYMALRQLYTDNAQKSENGVNYGLIEQSGMADRKCEVIEAIRQCEMLMGGRVNQARKCLNLISSRSANSVEKYANVIICNEDLTYGVCEVLLSGLAHTLPIENIYSTMKTTKEMVIERIQTRFGKKCSYIIVSSNPETTTIARKVKIILFRIIHFI